MDDPNVTSKTENQPSEKYLGIFFFNSLCNFAFPSSVYNSLFDVFMMVTPVKNSGICRQNEHLPSTTFGQIVPLARGAPATLAGNCLQAKYLNA